MISKGTVATLAIILLFLGAIYAPYKTATFQVYSGTVHPLNTDKFGTSDLVSMLEERGLQVSIGMPELLNEDTDLLVIIGPDQPYTEDESRRILEYLIRGGSILYVDEFNSPPFLKQLGIDIVSPGTLKEVFGIGDFTWGYCVQCNATYPLDIYGFVIMIEGIQVRRLESSPVNVVHEYGEFGGWENRLLYQVSIDLDRARTTVSVEANLSGMPLLTERDIEAMEDRDVVPITSAMNTYLFARVGDGRLVVVSDTAPFINHYLRKGYSNDFVEYVINYLLQGKDANYALVDASKILTVESRIKLPHVGLLILRSLEYYVSNLEKFYIDTVEAGSAYLPIGIAVLSLSIALGLRRRLRVPDEVGLDPGDVIEIDVAVEKDYIPSIENLNKANIKLYIMRLKKVLEDVGGSDAKPYIERLESLEKKVGRRFPPYPWRLARRNLLKILSEASHLLGRRAGYRG